MGITEHGAAAVSGTVDALRGQPLSIALIVINLVFIIGGAWIITSISGRINEGNIRRDAMLVEIIKQCKETR